MLKIAMPHDPIDEGWSSRQRWLCWRLNGVLLHWLKSRRNGPRTKRAFTTLKWNEALSHLFASDRMRLSQWTHDESRVSRIQRNLYRKLDILNKGFYISLNGLPSVQCIGCGSGKCLMSCGHSPLEHKHLEVSLLEWDPLVCNRDYLFCGRNEETLQYTRLPTTWLSCMWE